MPEPVLAGASGLQHGCGLARAPDTPTLEEVGAWIENLSTRRGGRVTDWIRAAWAAAAWSLAYNARATSCRAKTPTTRICSLVETMLINISQSSAPGPILDRRRRSIWRAWLPEQRRGPHPSEAVLMARGRFSSSRDGGGCRMSTALMNVSVPFGATSALCGCHRPGTCGRLELGCLCRRGRSPWWRWRTCWLAGRWSRSRRRESSLATARSRCCLQRSARGSS
jgi:hypothetical protein